MCNKYAKFSKVEEKITDKVKIINNLKYDDVKICERCLICDSDCKNAFVKLGLSDCEHYSQRYSLRELDEYIGEYNINLRRLCKKHKLNFGKMKDMLANKMILKYKYYVALENYIEKIKDDLETEWRDEVV